MSDIGTRGLLDGLRVVELAMFAPDMVGMHLADLGAEVIKVEAPGIGDPARFLGQPYRGASVATWRWNRGKRSITLDLRAAAGAQACRDLVASAEVVIEGMRPGALERRGLGYEDLLAVNPSLVFASVSGWGQDGPYRDLGAHGLGFDAYAGLAPPRVVDGRPARPAAHVWQGLESAPLYAAMAIVAAVSRARRDGRPCRIDVAEADAAVVANLWNVTLGAPPPQGLDADEAIELQAALAASAEGAAASGGVDMPAIDVRYQYYAARDGHVLFMATETKFWERFCRAVDRLDLFERWPGRAPADHDHGNEELRDELTALFAERTQAEWIELFLAQDIAGAPVHASDEVAGDPHFVHQDMWWAGPGHLRLPGSPVRVEGRYATAARHAPRAGQDTDAVLAEVLGYDTDRIAELRAAGALGALDALDQEASPS